jgi:hypothetical protein
MDEPASCFSPFAAGGGLSIGLSGDAALNILVLYDFSRHDRMDGLKNGSDEAFVTGAAGLILPNPNSHKSRRG